MKPIFSLRTLIAFSFALFFLPFLRTCSDESIRSSPKISKVEIIADANNNDTVLISKKAFDNLEKEITTDKQKHFEEAKKDSTHSFYGLLISTLWEEGVDLDTLTDETFYPLFGFLSVLILTIIVLIVSFFNRIKTIKILTVINLSLLITSTILLYFCDVIKSMNQIKVGFYLIFINFILIYIISRKIQKDNQLV